MVGLLDELRAQKDEIQALAAEYGISNIRIFGSVARGEERDDSDVDVLIDISPPKTYFDLIRFEMALQDKWGRDVDVVSEGGLYHYIRDDILSEAKPL